MLDIERLADRVLVIDHGEVKVHAQAAEFARQAGFAATVTIRGRGQPSARLGTYQLASQTVDEHNGIWAAQLRVPHWGGDVFGRLGDALLDVDVLEVEVEPVRLEDVYSAIMERLADDRQATVNVERG